MHGLYDYASRARQPAMISFRRKNAHSFRAVLGRLTTLSVVITLGKHRVYYPCAQSGEAAGDCRCRRRFRALMIGVTNKGNGLNITHKHSPYRLFRFRYRTISSASPAFLRAASLLSILFSLFLARSRRFSRRQSRFPRRFSAIFDFDC